MTFIAVVAVAIATISHTHQATPYSGDAGVSVRAAVGVAVVTDVGIGVGVVTDVGIDVGVAAVGGIGVGSGAVYSTEPMSWS